MNGLFAERSSERLTQLTRTRHDLIIVGGGIQGVMVALEAVRRGLRPLVLERGDFGAATSHNSLRILHGGLRYLQKLDLVRHAESVRERRWFLRTFPDFVEPLPCLMPLYGDGMARRAILGAALSLDRALVAGLAPDPRLPGGRVLSKERVRATFPGVDVRGLEGGANWHDLLAPSAPLLLLEILRWACAEGGDALNYVEVLALEKSRGRVRGVRARDLAGGGELTFETELVVNAAGPWSRHFAAACGDDRPSLFSPSLAWNLLLRRPALSNHALAVRARGPGGQTYFLVPFRGALLAGTGHAPWRNAVDSPMPTEARLGAFLSDLNRAVPGLDLRRDDIARVYSGLLPAHRMGTTTLARRAVIIDHGTSGGPSGLVSISGVKWTTSRRVADRALQRAAPTRPARPLVGFTRPSGSITAPNHQAFWLPAAGDDSWWPDLERMSRCSVVHLGDLLLRRSTLGDNLDRARALAPEICKRLGWSEEKSAAELQAFTATLSTFGGFGG